MLTFDIGYITQHNHEDTELILTNYLTMCLTDLKSMHLFVNENQIYLVVVDITSCRSPLVTQLAR